jgi:hypothetical protein
LLEHPLHQVSFKLLILELQSLHLLVLFQPANADKRHFKSIFLANRKGLFQLHRSKDSIDGIFYSLYLSIFEEEDRACLLLQPDLDHEVATVFIEVAFYLLFLFVVLREERVHGTIIEAKASVLPSLEFVDEGERFVNVCVGNEIHIAQTFIKRQCFIEAHFFLELSVD